MLLAAVILAAIATVALDVGLFFYWVASILTCFNSCPPVEGAADRWLTNIATYLSAGATLALAATILAILALLGRRSRVTLIVVIAVPLLALLVGALIMLASGGFVPYQDPGAVLDGADVVSGRWVTGAAYAALPLAVWPMATFLATLPLALRSAPPPAGDIPEGGISA